MVRLRISIVGKDPVTGRPLEWSSVDIAQDSRGLGPTLGALLERAGKAGKGLQVKRYETATSPYSEAPGPKDGGHS